MSDQAPNDSGEQNPTDPPPEGADPETFDKEYVEKLRREAAKYRIEAKAGSEAAKRLAEIEASTKSEAQRAADDLTAARQEAADARSDAARFRIAAKYGLPERDADVFLTGKDEDAMDMQGQRYAELKAEQGRPRSPKPDPNQGRSGTDPAEDKDAAARAMFGI